MATTSDAAATRKCAHAGCTCEIREGQTYCGPSCATAAGDPDVRNDPGRCECGHDSCRTPPAQLGYA